MSWTFKFISSEPDHRDFVKRVTECLKANKKPLIFCALPNEKADLSGKYYPFDLDGVFKIGSAAENGGPSAKVPRETANFLLPGEGIEVIKGKIEDGNSYSTAFAAGLAGLVLYILRMDYTLKKISERKKQQDADPNATIEVTPVEGIAQLRAEVATTREGMEAIFENLHGKNITEKMKEHSLIPGDILKFGDKFSPGSPDVLSAIASELLPKNRLKDFVSKDEMKSKSHLFED
ncbi:hypothetical protein ABW19_dt0206996 [Dactylella cylindrospora]|nr:hypothetical protein ABW19_dt0206996 [Dactylella cylindrospora]